MLVIGIDVLILGCFGLVCVFASTVASFVLRLTRREENAIVAASAATALAMLIGYIVMASVLDALLGAMGW